MHKDTFVEIKRSHNTNSQHHFLQHAFKVEIEI